MRRALISILSFRCGRWHQRASISPEATKVRWSSSVSRDSRTYIARLKTARKPLTKRERAPAEVPTRCRLAVSSGIHSDRECRSETVAPQQSFVKTSKSFFSTVSPNPAPHGSRASSPVPTTVGPALSVKLVDKLPYCHASACSKGCPWIVSPSTLTFTSTYCLPAEGGQSIAG